MSQTITKLINDKLKSIQDIFPGTHYTCIISAEGDTKITLTNEPGVKDKMKEEDLLQQVISLKNTAKQFGSTLSQGDTTGVIHIRGKGSLFSCYDIGKYHLAFYSDMPESDIERFDVGKADLEMEDMAEELQLLLNNLAVS